MTTAPLMRDRIRRDRLLAFLLAAAITSFGPAHANAACGTVVLPGGLGLSPVPDAPDTLHPILQEGSLDVSQLSLLLYRPLVWPDRGGIDWSRSIASGITVSPDRTRFTVALRSVHWSDGAPVTSADVLYAWSMIRALGHAYYDDGVGGVPSLIKGITVPDRRTVVITTTRKVNPEWFEEVGIYQLIPLPEHAWARYDLSAQQSLQSTASFYSVVDGPFRLASLQLGRDTVFMPNTGFDGHRPEIARLVVDALPGIDPLLALRTHTVDAATLPAALEGASDHLGHVRRLDLGAFPITAALTPNLVNPDKRFFADVRVRQAIASAINQEGIIRTAYHGLGTPQWGFVPASSVHFVPPEWRNGQGPFPFDPARADALLEKAGYRRAFDGIRVGHGERLAFTVLVTAGSDDALVVLQLIQADLQRVGVAMSITQLAFNQLVARTLGPATGWDAVLFGYSGGGFPDGTQYFASASQENSGHFSDPEMDRLLAAATTTPGLEATYAVERYAEQEQPIFFLPQPDPVVLVNPGLDGVRALIGRGSSW